MISTTRRFGLRTKWTLAVLLVVVAPIALLGWLVLDIQRDGLARAEKELEAAIVDEAAASVLTALAQASDVGSRVAAILADDRIDADARTRLVQDVVGRAPAVAGVAFFDQEKHFVDAVVPKGTMDETLRVPPIDRGFHGLRYEVPLEGRGFLVVVLSRAVLEKQLAEISKLRFGSPDRVYVVDDKLAVVLGPKNAVLPPFAGKPDFGVELLLTTELAGSEVGTMRTMPAQRWAMVVARPTDDAFAALATARRAFLSSVGVLALIALIGSFFFVKRVTGPIESLMALVRRYARREFTARSAITSGDELESLGGSLEKMADDLAASEHEIADRARLEQNLRRYLPKEAASSTFELGGTRKSAAIVFADVVGFTGFAERTSPEQAVAFLNELFTILSEIVFRHDGMVDKFIGDCVMAVFDSPSDALAAADDMHAFVASSEPRWRETYDFGVELGIGVAAGDVLIGNLGSRERMEYTVIGDAVNVAARLEMLARPRQTLATREVVQACSDLSFVSLGEHAIRGKSAMIEVFELAP